jgi:tol-pal system protein YbgF
MKRIFIFLIVLSCISVSYIYPIKKDTKLLLEELTKMQSGIEAIDQKVTAIVSGFSSLKKKVEIIEEKVSAITKNQADANQSKENLLLSLQFIKEELNELKENLNKMNDKITSMPVGGIPAYQSLGPAQDQQVVNQSPEKIYFTAYSDYNARNYNRAIDGFNLFIKLFPDNARADNSLYWVGECYYALKRYNDAVNTFNELIEKYSEGDKVPDATLKKAFALIETGRETEGVNVLKELISSSPFSEIASLAQQKIKEVME